MKTLALIVNPYSSRVTEERLEAVKLALAPYAQVATLETLRQGHAVELTRREAAGHDAVVAFSGDGVFNEVLNGLEAPIPVGFVPGGRTNVLPRALGLPRDPVEAARRIGQAVAAERSRTISLGRANGRRFAFAAGLGLDAEFVRGIEQHGRSQEGRLPGDLVAAWVLARMLATRGGLESGIEVEGHGRAAFVLVANADPYTYAGPFGLHLVPRACFELGLDFVAPVSVRSWTVPLELVRSAVTRATSSGFLQGHDLDRIEVTCDRRTALHVDGEDLGDVERVVFEAERGAARVLV